MFFFCFAIFKLLFKKCEGLLMICYVYKKYGHADKQTNKYLPQYVDPLVLDPFYFIALFFG